MKTNVGVDLEMKLSEFKDKNPIVIDNRAFLVEEYDGSELVSKFFENGNRTIVVIKN